MKREFLQNFKVGEQPLSKEIIDAIMAENGKDIEAAKAPFADYDTLKGQLTEAQNTLKQIKENGQTIEAAQAKATEWETKYNQAIEDHKAQMTNKNESLYDLQENRISKQSDAFFDLMKKRGIVPDNQIDDERIRQARQDVVKNAYHNTKVLLENYRSFQWGMECFPRTLADKLERPFDSLDRLLDRVDIEMAMGNRKLESKMQAVVKSRVLLDRVNDALTF